MLAFLIIFAGSLAALVAVQMLDVECVNQPRVRRAKQPAHRAAKSRLKGIIAATH